MKLSRGRALAARARPALISAFLILFCVNSLSCGRDEGPVDRYELKGKVVSVDRAKKQIVIDHEEVPGFMEAMVMPFELKDEEALRFVEGGDRIQATLVVARRGGWLENPVITRDGPAPNGAPAAGAAGADGPPAGAEVPDFSLVNQDGRPVSLGKYRGRALLVTFIYTRCPLPEYCPLMSENFAQINGELEKDPALRARAHLLSVTVDPEYDTPKVLRSYGAAHTEKYGEETFERWEFATGKPAEVRRVAEFFGMTYYAEKDQIIHRLITALITPDGKVSKIYRGNEWKPAEVLRDLRGLLSEPANSGRGGP